MDEACIKLDCDSDETVIGFKSCSFETCGLAISGAGCRSTETWNIITQYKKIYADLIKIVFKVCYLNLPNAMDEGLDEIFNGDPRFDRCSNCVCMLGY